MELRNLNFNGQVEKRLKLERTSTTATESQSQVEEESNNFVSRGSSTLSSPMFLLHQDQPSGNQITCSTQGNSEPPQAFLSIPQELPLTHQHQRSSQTVIPSDQIEIVNEVQDVDDIERLMQLLGIAPEEEQRDGFDGDGGGDSCHCEGGFYSKIVGVEGPKCKKEVLRLDGWIKHFLNGDGVEKKQEPLRLAHLLLGKASFLSEGGFEGLDFPSTIQEFLHTDPPSSN